MVSNRGSPYILSPIGNMGSKSVLGSVDGQTGLGC